MKKLYELSQELQDKVQEMVQAQDAINVLVRNNHEGDLQLKYFIYETLQEITTEDLKEIEDTLQGFRQDTTSYVGYSDFETERFFNLDLLFMIQEYTDQREEEEEEEEEEETNNKHHDIFNNVVCEICNTNKPQEDKAICSICENEDSEEEVK